MSGGVRKDNSDVRSLTESVSGSNRNFMFEHWSDYPGQLVIVTRGLKR